MRHDNYIVIKQVWRSASPATIRPLGSASKSATSNHCRPCRTRALKSFCTFLAAVMDNRVYA
jgi:hypothetical protein